MWRDSIITRAADAVEKLTVKSALNPALWLCGIVTIPCLIASAFFLPIIPTWLVSLACAPVAVTLFGFLYLLVFDRDKLQSESYQLRKQALELIEEKGDLRAIDASAIQVISNPDLPALPPPSTEGAE